jgi:glutamyl-tRNA synthetase
VEIFHALGAAMPIFGHFPLLVGADGEALSKRLGSLSAEQLRAQGLEPIAILSHLAKLGTSDPVEAKPDFATLVEEFSFDKIGRAPARFDPDELKRVNAAVLHHMPYDAAKPKLADLDADLGEAFWLAARANLSVMPDVTALAQIVTGPVQPVIADSAFAAAAAECLPPGPYGPESWSAFVDAVKARTGAKGKALFMPLRQALTGLDHGPEMAPLFALIGPDKARARLSGTSG